MRSFPFRFCALALAMFCIVAAGSARAQWVTESYALKPGWNAIWLPLDCSYGEIETVVAAQSSVQEIWRWNPLGSTTQYVTTPTVPVKPDAEWMVWRKDDRPGSTLFKLTGNAAYLVKVGGAQPVTLSLTGKPLPPRFNGQVTGLSFTGFPIDPAASAIQRRFARFFSFDSVLKLTPQVFKYAGGPLDSKNPVEVTLFTQATVDRGSAYWISAKDYTAYYGPVSIVDAADDALDFGSGGVARTIRVKNITDPTSNQSVTVTVKLTPSAPAPASEEAVAGSVPLLTRGALDPSTLQYSYTPFTSITTAPLASGEEQDFTFYLDRSAMANETGKAYQSVLQVTDSLKMTRVDLPVRAVSTTLAGLWVGELAVNEVDQIIGTPVYPDAAPSPTATPAPATGPFPVAQPFSQRVIIYIDATGKATLLQQAYLASEQNGVPRVYSSPAYAAAGGKLESPARISSAYFPLDTVAAGSGTIGRAAGMVTFDIDLGYTAPTNPFVHSYHPAHDNLNARFEPDAAKQLAAGVESYTVSRKIKLTVAPAGAGVIDPNWGNTVIGGDYSEVITGLRTMPINISGSFVLKRVATASTLVTQ